MFSAEQVRFAQDAWLQAIQSGPKLACTHAIESCRGLARACATLSKNLRAIDYPVARTIVPCIDADQRQLVALETILGFPPPATLVAVWRLVGGIGLVDLEEYRHVDFWESAGVQAEYCDGLYVNACDDEWLKFVRREHDDWLGLDEDERHDSPFALSLAPDGYHKDNISGGPEYQLALDDPWAPSWMNFEWGRSKTPASAPKGRIDFLSYLRVCVLECAGFPGLLGDAAFEPIRARLLADVPLF